MPKKVGSNVRFSEKRFVQMSSHDEKRYKKELTKYHEEMKKLRRSGRMTRDEQRKAEQENILAFLAQSDDSKHGLEIAKIENKGRGIKVISVILILIFHININAPNIPIVLYIYSFVKASKAFSKGDFLVEYAGDLVNFQTAKMLETLYAMDDSNGSFLFYFKHQLIKKNYIGKQSHGI